MGGVAFATVQKRRGRPAKQIDKRATSYSGIVAALPEEARSKLVFSREVFAKSYALSKWLSAYGLVVLSRHEFVVLQFITARTAHYGKTAEMITKEQFLRGVWYNSELVCGPVGGCARDLYKSLRALEEIGFISVLPLRIGRRSLPTMYEIAIDFITDSRPSEEIMSKLRAPRKKVETAELFDLDAFRQAKQGEVIGVKRHQPLSKSLVSNDTTKYTKVNLEDNEVLVASAEPRNEAVGGSLRARRKPRANTLAPRPTDFAIDCKERIRAVIQVASTRVTRKREAKVAHAAQGKAVSLSDLNATWKQAMITAYGSCTVAGLSTKEFGMFKRIAKAHDLAGTWLEFFTWVIDNWTRINRESKEFGEYRKQKKGDWSLKEEDVIFLGTAAPDLFMTVKNYGKLVKRYSQKTLATRTIAEEDSAEVKALKEELAKSKALERNSRLLMQRAVAAKTGGGGVLKERKSVAVVNPETDTFFDEADASLPRWK